MDSLAPTIPRPTTFLFWNLQSRDLAKIHPPPKPAAAIDANLPLRNAYRRRLREAVAVLAAEYDVDVLLLAEAQNLYELDEADGVVRDPDDPAALVAALNAASSGRPPAGHRPKYRFVRESWYEKIRVFHRLPGGVKAIRWIEPTGLRHQREDSKVAGIVGTPLPGHSGRGPKEYERRYALWRLRTRDGPEILLAAVHFPSIQYEQGDGQRALCAALHRDVREVERALRHPRSVLVGDFNATPFDAGMVTAYGLHAAPLADTVLHSGTALGGRRRLDGETYDYFYNPMWRHLAREAPDGSYGPTSPYEPPGTYYLRHHGRSVCFDWFLLDQVLVRPSLLDPGVVGLGVHAGGAPFRPAEVRIITALASGEALWAGTQKVPDAKLWSDHFPITFRLRLSPSTSMSE
jgi:hypothetical protein